MIHRPLLSRLSFVPSLLSTLTVSLLTLAAENAGAQIPEPPLPPPEEEEADLGADASASGSVEVDSPDATEGSAATDSNSEPWEQPVGEPGPASAPPPLTPVDDEGDDSGSDIDYEEWFRGVAIRRQMTIDGSTGLHRVREAGSGQPGTFRVNFNGSYFSKSDFICHPGAPCTNRVTGQAVSSDQAARFEAIGSLSVTPFSFLEAYISLYNSATSNTQGAPQVLQVVGDTSFGVKGYSPAKPDQFLYYGGDFDMYLMTGTSSVRLAGAATSFAFHGLLTLDLNNRTQESDRIPFRAHLNLGYKFDNSANIVEDLEDTPAPQGRGAPVERTERYGLGISRVDAFQMGFGAEYVNPWIRPYLEWTFDIPVNRQGYSCNIQEAASRGDLCLGAAAGFNTSPSRMTIGAKVFPWQASGLTTSLAIDIGTGGTSVFLEETTPEAPYTVWFGLGYVVDTTPPKPEQVVADAPTLQIPETRRYILGRVIEETSGAPIPQAIIRYDGVPMTGLVASAEGEFISQDLPPGTYNFKVFAEQFREGTCSVTIPDSAPAASAQAAGADPGATAIETSDPPASEVDGTQEEAEVPAQETAIAAPASAFKDADGNVLVPMDCKLQELPRIANVTGLLVDSQSSGPVPDATVTITDKLNRSLKLEVDAQGSFQFRNVPFGTARLTASAPGFMTTVLPIVIESREDLKPHILMNARPAKLALQVGRKEIKLDRPIQFVGDTAEVAIDSMSMVEELAVALKENAEIGSVEIQVHTDDSGAASYSRRISQQRADKIQELLIQLGVRDARLSAKGYGPDQPLAPNVSDESRARNNRVQIIVQDDALGGRR